MAAPCMEFDDDLTQFLNELGNKHPQDAMAMLPAIYHELRRQAHLQMRSERKDHTLCTTALVHEAWLRVLQKGNSHWANRKHFFAVAAEAMRHILVDYARRRSAARRGGDPIRVEFNDTLAISDEALDRILIVDQALRRLEQVDKRQAQIVALHFFVGLSYADIAELLEISERTVKRDWQFAQAWLYGELRDKKIT